jgi:hypothetical protein
LLKIIQGKTENLIQGLRNLGPGEIGFACHRVKIEGLKNLRFQII